MQNYEKGGIQMINIEKFIMSLKVTWVKKISDSCNIGVLNENYLKKLEKYFLNVISMKKTYALASKTIYF